MNLKESLKRLLLIFAILFTFGLAYAQTEDYFFGVSLNYDIKFVADDLQRKGLEIIETTNDSITLSGVLEPFGECKLVTYDKCKKITCRYSERIDSILRKTYGEPSICEDLSKMYLVANYTVASLSKEGENLRIIVLDLTELYTIKFKGVALGTPLKEVLPQLEQSFRYHTQYDGYTILEGKFAGYDGCSVYIDASEDDEIVSAVMVYFPDTDNWEALCLLYRRLKESLTEKYGEPVDCSEKNLNNNKTSDEMFGYSRNKIRELIKNNITCETTFGVSAVGLVKLSITGYETSNTAAVYLVYKDVTALEKKHQKVNEDL